MRVRFYLSILFSLIYFFAIAFPSNDDCSGALEIQVSADIAYYPVDLTLATTSDFTDNGNIKSQYGELLEYTGRDVWYYFNSQNFAFVTTEFDLFTSCGQKIAYTDPTSFQYNLSSNTIYYVAVREYSYGYGQPIPDSRGLYLQFENVSANAECMDATLISNPLPGDQYDIDSTNISFSNELMYYQISPNLDIIATIDIYIYTSCEFLDVDRTDATGGMLLEAGNTYYFRVSPRYAFNLSFDSYPASNSSCNNPKSNVGRNLDFNADLYTDTGTGPMSGSGLPTGYFLGESPETGNIRIRSDFNFDGTYKVFETNCMTEIPPRKGLGNYNVYLLGNNESYIIGISSSTSGSLIIEETGTLFDNDDCDSPALLSTDVNSTRTSILFNGDHAALQSEFIEDGAIDRWYEVDSDSTFINFSLSGNQSIYTNYQIYTQNADCTLSSPYGDVITETGTYNCPGAPFLLRAFTSRNSTLNTTNYLGLREVTSEALASNDECSGATVINNLVLYYDAGLMLNATVSSLSSCTQYENKRDLWYSYTPGGDRNISSETDHIVALYQNTCGNLELIDCNIQGNIVALEQGVTYFFRVFYTPSEGSFHLDETSTTVSSCNEAVELDINRTSERTSSAGYKIPYTFGQDDDQDRLNEVWYTFNTTDEKQSIRYRYTTGYKTLFTGDCNSLTEINTTTIGDTLIQLIPNQTYFLLLRSNDGLRFSYEFEGPIPPEDECIGSVNITMTSTPQLLALIDGPLGQSYRSNDFWFSFEAPSSGAIYVERWDKNISGRFGYVWSDCNDSEPLYPIDIEQGGIVNDLTPGETYYISTSEINNGNISYRALESSSNIDCSSSLSVVIDDCNTNYSGNTAVEPSKWFEFTMPASGVAQLVSANPINYNLYSGSCGSLESITESYEQIIVEAGSTVFIEIEEDQVFEFCIIEKEMPNYINNTCNNAHPMPDADNLVCAPYTIDLSPLLLIQPENYDNIEPISLWYKTTVQYESIEISSSNVVFQNLQNENYQLLLYRDCNSSPIIVNQTETIINDLTMGQEIFFEVKATPDKKEIDCANSFLNWYSANYSTEDYEECISTAVLNSSLSFDLCIDGLIAPAVNDTCQGAISLSLSPSSSCSLSQIDNTEDAYNRTFNCGPGTRELFYSYAPSEEQNLIVKLTDKEIQMSISIRSFSCNGSELICGVDSLIFTALADSTYYILVSPLFEDENTAFDLCISEYEIPEGGEGYVGVNIENPIQPLHVDGAITIGAAGIPLPGTVRYTGRDFEGYTNQGWKSLTTSSGATSNSSNIISDNLGDHMARQDLEMDGKKIRNLPQPISPRDAVNKEYVDNLVSTLDDAIDNIVVPNDIGGSQEGEADNLGNHNATQSLDLNNNRITNVSPPLSNTDAANKVYVDNLIEDVIDQIGENTSTLSNGNTESTGVFNPFGNNDAEPDNLGNHEATQSLDMSSFLIENLATPSQPSHATNKAYVDQEIAFIQGVIDDSNSNENYGIENMSIEIIDPEFGAEIPTLNIDDGFNLHSISMERFDNGWNYNSDLFGGIISTNGNVGIGLPLASSGNIGLTLYGKQLGFTNTPGNSSLNLFHNIGVVDSVLVHTMSSLGPAKMVKWYDDNADEVAISMNINHKRLGVGVENPKKELDMVGTLQIKKNSSSGNPHLNIIEDGNDFVRLNMTNSTNTNIAIAALPTSTVTNAKINFNFEGTGDVLTIAGNDRLGINDNSPDYTLDVEAQGGANPLRIGTSSASDTYIKVLSNGDVGLGADPDSDVHIHHESGTSTRGLRIENKSTSVAGDHWRFYVSEGGDLRLYNNTTSNSMGNFNKATGAYTSTSDRRLKSNISDLHFDWDQFMSLKPSNYFFNSDKNKRIQLGLIAQDVEQVYPEIIYKNEETGMYKMDYSGTGVIAIKAVQELKKENERLKEKNVNLEKRMQTQDEILINLTNQLAEIKKTIKSLEK